MPDGEGVNEVRPVVYTVSANCQDCYRCIRACPVKAIRIRGGQANIDDSLCIKCGTCVRECPQKAKVIRSDLAEVKALMQSGRELAASLAPSFAAAYNGWRAKRLPAALRKLGFKYVTETAEGAEYITRAAFQPQQTGCICTACPAVVNYIEKYKPDYKDMMIPLVSPMVAHGRMLKQQYPDCAVVFIGPCAAKKSEAQRTENADAIDAALTFQELDAWLAEENIELSNCSEGYVDMGTGAANARLFPLPGGMLKTAGISCDETDEQFIQISGADEIVEWLGLPPEMHLYKAAEPLFCKGGCINGPAFKTDERNIFERRHDVIQYAQHAAAHYAEEASPTINVTAAYYADLQLTEVVTENQIHKVLEKTGKSDSASQLNCGACGYKSCRDNAEAVVRGMAEVEMCMPYMRRQAQQRTDRIIETTPNGVLILDNELTIINMNPAFQRMFMCNNGLLGRRVSYLLNAEGFEKLLAGTVEIYESIRSQYGIKYHEILYRLREEEQFVGIYSDISRLKYDARQLDVVKIQTLQHAQEFLDQQIRFSQEMAHYLGKSTAHSEEMVKRLMDLYGENGDKES